MYQTKFLLLFIIFATLISMQCNEECPHRFHLPAEIIPYQLEYHVGDTIRFVSKFEKNVHELQTDMKYDMSKKGFGPNTVVVFLDTIGRSKITDYFKFSTINSTYIETGQSEGSVLIGYYDFLNDSFSLEYILIPKYPGNYFLIQKCGVWDNFPGRCRHVYYDAIVDMNMGKDGNINLLKVSKDTLYSTIPEQVAKSQFYDKGGFCFRVVP